MHFGVLRDVLYRGHIRAVHNLNACRLGGVVERRLQCGVGRCCTEFRCRNVACVKTQQTKGTALRDFDFANGCSFCRTNCDAEPRQKSP